MFLRRRIVRVSVSRHVCVFPSPKAIPSRLFSTSASFQLPEPSRSSSSFLQKISPAISNHESELLQSVSLQSLKDQELLSIIRRTVETRKEVPFLKRRDARKSYSRAAGATYANVYLELRRRGTQSLIDTYPEVFVYIAEHCVATGDVETLKCTVEDSMKLYAEVREGHGSEKAVERHYRALKNILTALASSHAPRPRGPIPLQHHIHTLELFRMLLLDYQPLVTQTSLSLDTLNGVLRSIVSLSADWKRVSPLLEPLLRCVQNLPPEKIVRNQVLKGNGRPAPERSMNSISSRLHRLIHLTAVRESQSLSFMFLEVLLQKGIIPSQVLSESDSALDFRDLMISVLLRWAACCGWSDRALQVLRTELPRGAKLPAEYFLNGGDGARNFSGIDLNTGSLGGDAEQLSRERFQAGASTSDSKQEHYSVLANDLLSSFVVADPLKLVHCSHIVAIMMSQFPSIKLNNALVHAFFKAAREVNAAAAAELMYATLRATCHLDHYVNGLLHGGVVPWLLGHLVYQSKNRIVAENLVRDLIKTPNEMGPFERGDVISICADAGFVAETRSLWERYAVGPTRKLVTGHTKCMVGIVKLFKRISEMSAKVPENSEHGKQDMSETKETKNGEMASNDLHGDSSDQRVQSRDIGTAASQTIPQRISLGAEADSDVVPVDSSLGARTSAKRRSSIGSASIPEATVFKPEAPGPFKATSTSQHDTTGTMLAYSDVEQHGGRDDSEPVTRNTAVYSDPEPDEYTVFAYKVLDAYRRAKEPLRRASHYDLNAIARASDMLGSVRQSMQALHTIVDRKEVPDTYDMNVVMIAMAARDPMRAEEMLGLMLQEGMHLNALTFVAVITGWLKKGHTKRASRVYSRAMRAGYAKLSADVGTNLLIALVDLCSSSEVEGSTNEQVQSDIWMQRTRLRQAYSLIKTESCRVSSLPPDLGERCVSAALRLEEAGLALYFWRRLVKTAALSETDQRRALRHGIARLVEKATKKGSIGAEEKERMIDELGPL